MILFLASNVFAQEQCAEKVSYPGPLAQWATALIEDSSSSVSSGPAGSSDTFTDSDYGVSSSDWADDSDCDASVQNPVGEYWTAGPTVHSRKVVEDLENNRIMLINREINDIPVVIINNVDNRPNPFTSFKILPLSGSASSNDAEKDENGNIIINGETDGDDVFLVSVKVNEDKSVVINWAKIYNYLVPESLSAGGLEIVGGYAVMLTDSTSGKVSALSVDLSDGSFVGARTWGYTDPVVGGLIANLAVAGDDAASLNANFDSDVLGTYLPQFFRIAININTGEISETYAVTFNIAATGVEVIQAGSRAPAPANGDNVAVVNINDPLGWGVYAVDNTGNKAYAGVTGLGLSKGFTAAGPAGGNYLAVASQSPSDEYQVAMLDTTNGEFLWSDSFYRQIITNDVYYDGTNIFLAGYAQDLQRPFAAVYNAVSGQNVEKAEVIWSEASGNPKMGTRIIGFNWGNVLYYMLASEGSFGIQIYGLGGAEVPEFSLSTLLLALLLAGGLLFVIRRRR